MKNLALLIVGMALLAGLFWWMKPATVPYTPGRPESLPPVAAAPAAEAPPPEAVVPPQVFEIEVREKKLVRGLTAIPVAEGSEVVIKVTSDHQDELHLHGYDLTLPLPAGKPAELRFVADRSGRFEYELHHANVELGALEVYPR